MNNNDSANQHPQVPLIFQLKRLLSYNACNKLAGLLGDVNEKIPNRSILSLQKYVGSLPAHIISTFENSVWSDYNALIETMNEPILAKIKDYKVS